MEPVSLLTLCQAIDPRYIYSYQKAGFTLQCPWPFKDTALTFGMVQIGLLPHFRDDFSISWSFKHVKKYFLTEEKSYISGEEQ